MTWSFSESDSNRADVIARIKREHQPIIDTYSYSTQLWTLYKDPYGDTILLFLIEKQNYWGYKIVGSESVGTQYYSCPIEFLAVAEVRNTDWRDKVYEWHHNRGHKSPVLEIAHLSRVILDNGWEVTIIGFDGDMLLCKQDKEPDVHKVSRHRVRSIKK